MPPLLEVLPLKRSQDTSVSRRLLYLDQNVVSNIAKFRLKRPAPNELQQQATARLYDAIKLAVLEREDALCIESMFHRRESSELVNMAKKARKSDAYKLFHEISQFITYYSRALRLSPCFELRQVQAVLAVATRLGLVGDERRSFNWRVALTRDPQSPHKRDGREVEFGGDKFVLGVQWSPRTSPPSTWAERVSSMRAANEFPDFETAMIRAKREQRASAVKDNEYNSWAGGWTSFDNPIPRQAMDEFIQSEDFFDLPVHYVGRHLYAHVLAERTRAFSPSDPIDIDILSAAIPYSDVVITDRYMAEAATQRGLDAAFNTTILPATAEGFDNAAAILSSTT